MFQALPPSFESAGELAVDADVARDLADLLVRHVEPVLAAEGELEVVAGDARDLSRLEAEQLAEAVVLVDDVVAGAQLGERLERSAGGRGSAARAAAEDLRVRQKREPEVAPDEASPSRADGEEELRLVGELLAGLHEPRFDPAQEVLRAERFALERKGDDGAEAGPDERAQLVLGFGQAARGDRGALGLEREGLAGGERIELDGVVQRHRLELLFGPDLAHVPGLPDEVRAGRDRWHEVVGNRARRIRVLVVVEPQLDEIESPLGGGVDRRRVNRVQRALREGRERADALDLVAEELDAERLATRRRIDVDDPAAKRELPALLGLVDPLVAGERELLGDGVDAGVVAGGEADRRGPRLRRGHLLGERCCRRADEPAGRKDVEGARSLADEVRRRLEPRAPADAPAREERHVLVSDEPAGGLGDVARVRVLGREDDERPAELFVQRRDQQRERRFRDARACVRELVDERAKALAVGELANERVQHGSVHDD